MVNSELLADKSFTTYLSTDIKPTTGVNGTIALVVDTQTWYVLHEGTWYAQ